MFEKFMKEVNDEAALHSSKNADVPTSSQNSGNSTKPPVSRSKPAVLEIKHCTDCPHFERRRMYTADSWEEAYDWFCKKENGKKIQGYVEWNEAADVKVPDWCPLRG